MVMYLVLLVANENHNVDILDWRGPEGVIAASALDAFGCKFKEDFYLKPMLMLKEQKWV